MAKPYYNPAVAGATEDLNILALARLEMIGVHGAPKSFFITADMPLTLGKTNHGAVTYTHGWPTTTSVRSHLITGRR